MSQYELILLLENEEDLKPVQELIASLKGEIKKEEKWGKKTLTYPIKKVRSAFYLLLHLTLDNKHLKEFKSKLNFNEKIIRYLLLKVS